MRQPHVDDFVRLKRDIPELSLCRGQLGVIRSTWCEPYTAYEVEFQPRGHATRALVMRSQIQPADDQDDRY